MPVNIRKSRGALAGITVSVIIVLLGCVALFTYLLRRSARFRKVQTIYVPEKEANALPEQITEQMTDETRHQAVKDAYLSLHNLVYQRLARAFRESIPMEICETPDLDDLFMANRFVDPDIATKHWKAMLDNPKTRLIAVGGFVMRVVLRNISLEGSSEDSLLRQSVMRWSTIWAKAKKENVEEGLFLYESK
ncbi:hypothetical protein MMC24_003609 [Lignoscripta atroalba]|nr:hypothetical protein [Lignoscripta atroalba]